MLLAACCLPAGCTPAACWLTCRSVALVARRAALPLQHQLQRGPAQLHLGGSDLA
eukprot:SAG25_NODE_5829_length_617_cov_0.689189_1_plen_54_part_10